MMPIFKAVQFVAYKEQSFDTTKTTETSTSNTETKKLKEEVNLIFVVYFRARGRKCNQT